MKKAPRYKDYLLVSQLFSLVLIIISTFVIYKPFVYFDTMLHEGIFFLLTILFLITMVCIVEKLYNKQKTFNELHILATIINLVIIVKISCLVLFISPEEHFFELLYILPVITVSLTNGVFHGVLMTSLAGGIILYNSIVLGDAYVVDDYTVIIFVTILFMVSWLIGSFFEREKLLRSQLESKVNIDELTGLNNYRYMKEELDNIFDNSNCHDLVSLIYADLDNFKYYNDNFGHTEGDKVLKQTGEILRECTPKGCTVARYGGDEFVIILPGFKEEEAKKISRNIEKRFESEWIESQTQKDYRVSISMGIASIENNGKNKGLQLIKKADKNLYKKKGTPLYQ